GPWRIWIEAGPTEAGSISLLKSNSSTRFSGTLSSPDWTNETRTTPGSVSPVATPPVDPPQPAAPAASASEETRADHDVRKGMRFMGSRGRGPRDSDGPEAPEQRRSRGRIPVP